MKREAIERIQAAVAYTVLGLLLLLVLFPFYWMTVTSFKTEDQMRSLVSMFWPSPFVVENYTPGIAERLGFGWKQVHARNPSAIMLSTCMRGQTGPEARHIRTRPRRSRTR